MEKGQRSYRRGRATCILFCSQVAVESEKRQGDDEATCYTRLQDNTSTGTPTVARRRQQMRLGLEKGCRAMRTRSSIYFLRACKFQTDSYKIEA